MKILVTGIDGMLGRDIMETLSSEHELVGVNHPMLDLTSLSKTLNFIKAAKPEAIINCAAYTNVDACETNISLAFRSNADIPKNLAIASELYNIYLIHISSDYIFDGLKNIPYVEDDQANPLNVYGKSKLMGEKCIYENTSNYLIVRTQWMYGSYGKNFVKTMLNLFKEKSEIMVVNDQFGSPTYSLDFCAKLNEIIKLKLTGVIHITNSGFTTWFDFTKTLILATGEKNVQIIPCSTKKISRPALRPAFAPLENQRLKVAGFSPLRSYQEAVWECIKKLNIF